MWHEVQVVCEGGITIDGIDSYTITTEFLTPCAGWSIELGGLTKWRKYSGVVKEGAKVQVYLDGVQIMMGWIDAIDTDSDADGFRTSINGRDHLKPLVKANVHPNTVIKDLTIAQAVEKVLVQVYRSNVPTIYFDNEANRKVLTRKTSKKGKPISTAKQIEQLQPQAGEGAFEFLIRLLRRNGLWMWGTTDGGIVVGKPNYEQAPSYTIQRGFGDTESMVRHVRVRRDKTNVPSHVFVTGKGGKKGDKSSVVQARAVDDTWSMWSPSYVKHDEVTTPEEATNIAVQEMSRHKQNEFVYEVTLKGHKDTLTDAYYAMDTVAHVHDEVESIDADMYASNCTWSRNASETTTKLKLVNLYSIVFAEEDKP